MFADIYHLLNTTRLIAQVVVVELPNDLTVDVCLLRARQSYMQTARSHFGPSLSRFRDM